MEKADEDPSRKGGPKGESNTERGGKNRQKEDDAEKKSSFLSRYRQQLEDYVAHPSATGVLVLELRSFPANTNLAKAVAAAGLAIDCNVVFSVGRGTLTTVRVPGCDLQA